MTPTELTAAAATLVGHPLRIVAVLAEVPGERLVLRLSGAGASVVAKWSADPAALVAVPVLARLSRSLDPAGVASVPRVVATDPGAGIVVTTDLGVTSLAAGAPSRAILHRVGRALAEVHAAGAAPDTAVPVSIDDHLAVLVAPHPHVLAEQVPAWAPVIRVALEHLALLEVAATVPRCLVHRDVNMRNLLAVPADEGAAPQVGFVDWDLAAVGDPAFDVAYLLTHLEHHGAGATTGLPDAFLAGYRSHPFGTTVLAAPDIEQRLAGYRLFNLIRRACRRHRLADDGWLVERDRMLALAADALDLPHPPELGASRRALHRRRAPSSPDLANWECRVDPHIDAALPVPGWGGPGWGGRT